MRKIVVIAATVVIACAALVHAVDLRPFSGSQIYYYGNAKGMTYPLYGIQSWAKTNGFEAKAGGYRTNVFGAGTYANFGSTNLWNNSTKGWTIPTNGWYQIDYKQTGWELGDPVTNALLFVVFGATNAIDGVRERVTSTTLSSSIQGGAYYASLSTILWLRTNDVTYASTLTYDADVCMNSAILTMINLAVDNEAWSQGGSGFAPFVGDNTYGQQTNTVIGK